MSYLFSSLACAANPQERPTYYQLLDISPDEGDPQVIEQAALRRSSEARTYQITHESESTLRLNEIAQAMITLLDPARRRDYDRSIGNPSAGGRTCDVMLVYP
jgi:hypothetical protein